MAKIYYNDNGTWKVVDVPGGGSGGVDPTANLQVQSITVKTDIPNYIQIYPDNIQYYDDNGDQKMYLFPTKSGVSTYTFLTNANVKTLFGNKSIVGSGNIDLYVHSLTITFTPDTGGYDPLTVYAKIPSSNNLNIDSLTDLKTILGNTFNEPLYGGKQIESSDYGVGLYMTETALYWQLNGHNIHSKTWANVTITDTVKTV